ncbi:MAG: efflux RND transporter periplasmic adaptor subunit [Acetobacteraceae bacterium]|nr:efflux RND transporter periplasmic adaptor subunit [Acetobacteraceae bacterium]
MIRQRWLGLALLVLAVALATYNWGTRPGPAATPPSMTPIPVTPGRAVAKDVPIYVIGMGTVQAFNTVAVKSRVDGHVVKVLFQEGAELAADAPLFLIDPRPYQAALDQAQAAKQKDEAQLEGAQRNLVRYAKLIPSGFQTRQSYEDQLALVNQLQAALKADQAQIETAQINLGFTLIRAPITGRTGARLVDIGNFIQASQGTTLVMMTQLRPIFVSFTVPGEELDRIRHNQAKAALDVLAYDQANTGQLASGKLTLIDNQIDTSTGTIHLKASFENEDERLWPGEFISCRVVVSIRHNAVTVPAETVMQGPDGHYLYVIEPDQTVQRRDVEVLAQQDGIAVIGKGIPAGQQVVVNGQYRLTNGAKVRLRTPEQPATS